MSNYETLKAAISTAIKQNGNEEITGQVLQTTLLSMVDSLVSGYLFKGIATPSTVVGTPDENVFWIAPAGSYSNFGATPIDVPTGCIGIFQYNGSFTNTVVYVGGTVDISSLSHTSYASLSQALGDLPAALHIGGISVKFEQSTTSKYVKYRLMATSWSTTASDWQSMNADEEPTAGSDNLVKSGGTDKKIKDLRQEIYGGEVYTDTANVSTSLAKVMEFNVEGCYSGDTLEISMSKNYDSNRLIFYINNTDTKIVDGYQAEKLVTLSEDVTYIEVWASGNDAGELSVSFYNTRTVGTINIINEEMDGLSERCEENTQNITDLHDDIYGNILVYSSEASVSTTLAQVMEFSPNNFQNGDTIKISMSKNYNSNRLIFYINHTVTKIVDGYRDEQFITLTQDVSYIEVWASGNDAGELSVSFYNTKFNKEGIDIKTRLKKYSGTFPVDVRSIPLNVGTITFEKPIKRGGRFIIVPTRNYSVERYSMTKIYANGNVIIEQADWHELIAEEDISSIDVYTAADTSSQDMKITVDVYVIEKESTARTIEHIYTTDNEKTVFNKMLNAVIVGNVDVYFEKGTYIFDSIYDVLRASNKQCELPIGGNCRYYFNNSTIRCSYSGSLDTKKDVSTLGCSHNLGGFELHDGIIECVGCRYCVHDEVDGSSVPYTNIYDNIRMVYTNTQQAIDSISNRKCIGGGLGKNPTIKISGCEFGSDATLSEPLVAYHSSAVGSVDDDCSFVVCNSYIDTMSITLLSGTTEPSISGSLLLVGNYITSFITNGRLTIKKWNNVTSLQN